MSRRDDDRRQVEVENDPDRRVISVPLAVADGRGWRLADWLARVLGLRA